MCFFFVRDSGEGEDDRGKKRLRLSIEEKEEGAGYIHSTRLSRKLVYSFGDKLQYVSKLLE